MKHVSRFYNFLVFAFLYSPIVVMIVYSFNGIKSRSVFEGFSLQWYKELFNDAVIMKSLYVSLVIAVLAAVISTVIGTLAAVGINSMKGFKKKMYLSVNNIPMVNPEIVTAVSMMILFVFIISKSNTMEMGFGTLLISISHSVFLMLLLKYCLKSEEWTTISIMRHLTLAVLPQRLS